MDRQMCGLCEWVKDVQCASAVVVHCFDCIVLATFKDTVSYTLLLTTHSCCAVDSTAFFIFERPRIVISTKNDSS
jgi:hypothetical protein